jgi:VanZ family protein
MNPLLRKVFSRWGPVVALAAGIFWLSEQSQADVAPLLPFAGADKVAHAVEYGAFGLVARRAFTGRLVGISSISGTIGAVALAAAYGAFDEWHQSWDPSKHRVAGADDALADAVGATVACGVVELLARRRRAPGET